MLKFPTPITVTPMEDFISKIQTISAIGKLLYYGMMTHIDLFSQEYPKDRFLDFKQKVRPFLMPFPSFFSSALSSSLHGEIILIFPESSNMSSMNLAFVTVCLHNTQTQLIGPSSLHLKCFALHFSQHINSHDDFHRAA